MLFRVMFILCRDNQMLRCFLTMLEKMSFAEPSEKFLEIGELKMQILPIHFGHYLTKMLITKALEQWVLNFNKSF